MSISCLICVSLSCIGAPFDDYTAHNTNLDTEFHNTGGSGDVFKGAFLLLKAFLLYKVCIH